MEGMEKITGKRVIVAIGENWKCQKRLCRVANQARLRLIVFVQYTNSIGEGIGH